MDVNKHNFINVPQYIKIKYKKFIDDDLMCINCGICVCYNCYSDYNNLYILNIIDGIARPSLLKLKDYEFSCNELIIKSLLE